MINPYIKKDDILKLIEKLAGDSEYICKKDLQKAITFTKEYPKPKEAQKQSVRGKIYIPYNSDYMIDNIKKYKRMVRENPKLSPFFSLSLGIEPPFQVKYEDEIIDIEDFVLHLKDIESILGVSRATRVQLLKAGYIQEFKEFTLVHENKTGLVPCRFYLLNNILINLKGRHKIIP